MNYNTRKIPVCMNYTNNDRNIIGYINLTDTLQNAYIEGMLDFSAAIVVNKNKQKELMFLFVTSTPISKK